MLLWMIQTNSNDFQFKQANYNNQMILLKDINLNKLKFILHTFTIMNGDMEAPFFIICVYICGKCLI